MEELFDVCDENGKLAGYTQTRSAVHAQGLWHKSAQIWIVDSRSRILLQRRDPAKETDPGKWDISVAGHLSAGQTVVEAAVREAQEELGLTLDPSELELIFSVRREYLEPVKGFFDREIHHNFVCRRDVDLAQLVLQPGEVVDVAWQPLAEFQARVEGDDPELVGRPREYTEIFRFLGLDPLS